MVGTYLADDSGLQEYVQSLVNGCQRDGRQLRSNPLKDLLGAGMIRHLHQLPVDDESLMSYGHLLFTAELLKILVGELSH